MDFQCTNKNILTRNFKFINLNIIRKLNDAVEDRLLKAFNSIQKIVRFIYQIMIHLISLSFILAFSQRKMFHN